MKRHWVIRVAWLIGLIGACYLAWARLAPGPSYGDRSLNSWVRELRQEGGNISQAIEAFQKMGPKAVPPLVSLLQTKDASLNRTYTTVFGKLPVKLQKWMPTPEIDSAQIRQRAADVLGKLPEGPFGLAVAPLIAAAKDSDARVRMAAVSGLAKCGARAGSDVVGALMMALLDSNAIVRINACFALGRLGPNASEAAPALTLLLQDSDANLQATALNSLTQIGPAAEVAILSLEKLLAEDRVENRTDVAHALCKIDPRRARRMGSLLVRWARLADGPDRSRAIDVLGEIGPVTEEVIPTLLEGLDSKQKNSVRWHAAAALNQLGSNSTPAMPALHRALHDKDDLVVANVAQTLGKIGPSAKAAVPALTLLLESDYLAVREAAAQALQKIEPVSKNESRKPVRSAD